MTPLYEYIYRHDGEVREVLDFINEYIINHFPNINASIKWRVPYYTGNKQIGYQNVLKNGKTVELNFIHARKFNSDIQKLLNFRGRKIVGGVQYTSLEDIIEDNFEKLIEEAIRVDIELN